jgi:peptidoglycan/LPS O-acetylase OafA/YrhL
MILLIQIRIGEQEKMNKKYNIADLLKQRTIWMAAAIFLVIFFHGELEVHFPGLGPISKYGHFGVDIFFFASGVGCWFSLSKDEDPAGFILRRIRKIVPTYLLFLVFWCSFQIIANQMPADSILGNALGVEFFRKSNIWTFNWYITGMWVSYIAAPVLFSFARKLDGWRAAIVPAFLYVLTIPFIGYVRHLIILTRLPVFYLGLMTGKMAEKGKTVTLAQIIFADIASIGGIILTGILCRAYPDHNFDWGLGWYPAIIVIPGICATLSLIGRKIEGTAAHQAIEIIGKYTFELYLSHVFLFEFILLKYPIPTNYGTELLAIVISCCMAFALHSLAGVLFRRIGILPEKN